MGMYNVYACLGVTESVWVCIMCMCAWVWLGVIESVWVCVMCVCAWVCLGVTEYNVFVY